MLKKLCIGLVVMALFVGAVCFFVVTKTARVPAAVSLFAKDTMFYSGTRSPIKIATALACADIESILQSNAGLTEEEGQFVANWLRDVQGVHFGFRSFTMVPFVLNAGFVLDGSFERPLTDILGVSLQRKLVDGGVYREVSFERMSLPFGSKFSLELYISDPVEDRVFVAFSKRALEEMVDRLLDGGASLADNAQFVEMTSLKELRNTDTLQYMDVEAYLNLVYDWAQLIPQPELKALVDLFWKEFRLADYECMASGSEFLDRTSVSCLKLNPENPLISQFAAGDPLPLPYVPPESSQFCFYRLSDPTTALGQLVEWAMRVERGISGALGAQAGAAFRVVLQEISAMAEKHPAELGELLTGEIGFWQRYSSPTEEKSASCFYLGITDADAVKTKIDSITGMEIVETNGVFRAQGVDDFFWSVQSNRLLIATDVTYLKDSLAERELSLTETKDFLDLLKKLPTNYSTLQYANYEQSVFSQDAGYLHRAVLPVLDLLKGFRQLSVSCAEDGLLKSYSTYHFDADRQWLETLAKFLFSSVWEPSAPEEESPFEFSAEEAYNKSLELLSDGRQIEAEELVDRAVREYTSDCSLLFAKAVLERSRWDKRAAFLFFSQVIQRHPDCDSARASVLSLALDGERSDEKLKELATLSDANPEDIYLLWLSAIQCREQKNGPLGKERYEKLLAKLRVGPVLLHQTYANILEDYLEDYETALKHRYVAVSLESKGWTLHGLACTLNEMGRHQEASAVLARTVQVEPDNRKYWGSWGWTLRTMGRYEEALEKHQEAFRLDPSSAYNIHSAGYCLEKLKRYDEMIEYYRRASMKGYARSQYALGWCYEYARGVERDLKQAFEFYLKAAEQGLARSQFKVGYFSEKGRGVEKNFEQAVKWYRRAAEQGNVTAWSNLGLLYGDGKGVELDYNQELACYKKALDLDSNDAHTLNSYAWMLATCKDKSFRDYPKAVELAERSVELDEQFYSLDTLAVAYERNGDFGKAVETQKRLIARRQKKNPKKEIPARMLKRLAAFEKKASEADL